MNRVISSEFEKYTCNCTNAYIPKSEICAHLQLPFDHKISIVSPSIQSPKKFHNSILAKIAAISKIQSRVQQSSVCLTRSIIQNTELAITKLSHLIRLYKTILLDKHQDNELLRKDIISNFTINNSLEVSLQKHFEQTIVAEKWNIDELNYKIKSKILDVYNDKSFSFECIAVFSDESFLVTGGYGGFIQVWDMKKNAQSYSLKKCKGDVYCLALGSGDEIMLSGSGDRSVRLWDLKSRKKIHKFEGHNYLVYSVFISNDNKIGFSGSLDETIKIWNLEKKELENTLYTSFGVYEIRLIRKEKVLVATGTKGCIYFWNKKTSKSNSFIINANITVSCFCFSKDERYFITGNSDGSVKIFFNRDLKIIFEEKKHKGEITKIEFSPSSQFFASCSRNEHILIWDFNSKSLVNSINIKNNATSVKFLKNSNNLVFCSGDPKIGYINLKTKQTESKIDPKMLFDSEIAISSDLKYFAYINSKIHLYDLELSKKILKTSSNNLRCTYLKFSPCCTFLISGYLTGEVILFKLPCLTQVTKIHLNKSKIISLAMSFNKRFLACSCKEDIIDIYCMETNDIVFTDGKVYARSAAFCYNDKRFIYAAGYNGLNILDEFFNKVAVINFEHMTYRLLVCNDGKTLIASDTQSNWSGVNAVTAEIIFKDKNRKEFIWWSKEREDAKCQVFVNLVGINI